MKIVKNWLEKDLAFRVRNFLLDQQYKYTERSLAGRGPSFFSSHFDIYQNKHIRSLFPLLVSQFDHDIKIIKVLR